MRKSISFYAALLAACSFCFHPAKADFLPDVDGEILVELQNDWAFESDDATADVNTMFTTVEPYLVFTFNENLSLVASLIFEPVQATDPNDDTFFDNQGLFAEEVKLEFAKGNFLFYGGKYNPTFGTAWDMAPGIWGVDFAEDYELAEMIGFGAGFTFDGGKTGTHTINAGTFFADTSFLSQSLFTDRGNLSLRDGGIANTESLSSFSTTLDTENLGEVGGLNSHIGFRHLEPGDADAGLDSEHGFVGGLSFTTTVGETVQLDLLGEAVFLNDVGGTADSAHYYTGSAMLGFGNGWNIAVSGTARMNDISTGSDTDDTLLQLTGGREFDNGITTDLGYRFSDESDIETHIIGFLLTRTFILP